MAGQNGFIEGATNTRLKVAVDPREFENAVAFLALPIDAICEGYLRLGQGAGLVDAEHVHGAQIVDRGKPLDDDLLQGHALGSARQRDRHDHRQKFRREADRQRYGKEDRLHCRPCRGEMCEQHEQRQEYREAQDQKAETPYTLLQGGWRNIGGKGRCDRPEPGSGAGLNQ